MRIPRLVATGTATLIACIGTLTLGLAVVLTAVPTRSPFGLPQADAQPPSGTFTPNPSTGSDVSAITGVTNGTCDVPGSEAAPVDGFNAVVTGPGAFAPNPGVGRFDGLAIVSTSDDGFSTSAPIPFTFRSNFRGLAEELGTTLEPGNYVVTFRCVNQFDGVVYQTFRATFTFTTPTTYMVTNPPPSTSPTPTPTPTPTATTTVASGGSPGANGRGTGTGSGGTLASVATMVIAGLVISALGVVLLAVRRRRAG